MIVIQVAVINNLELSVYVNPFLYIVFIMMLPFNVPKWLLLVSSFLIGYLIDVFSNSGGIHAAASVFIAYLRPSIFSILSFQDETEDNSQPNINNLGFIGFLSYTMIMVFIHHFVLFTLEYFSISEIFHVIYKTFLSGVITIFLIILIQYLFIEQRAERR